MANVFVRKVLSKDIINWQHLGKIKISLQFLSYKACWTHSSFYAFSTDVLKNVYIRSSTYRKLSGLCHVVLNRLGEVFILPNLKETLYWKWNYTVNCLQRNGNTIISELRVQTALKTDIQTLRNKDDTKRFLIIILWLNTNKNNLSFKTNTLANLFHCKRLFVNTWSLILIHSSNICISLTNDGREKLTCKNDFLTEVNIISTTFPYLMQYSCEKSLLFYSNFYSSRLSTRWLPRSSDFLLDFHPIISKLKYKFNAYVDDGTLSGDAENAFDNLNLLIK